MRPMTALLMGAWLVLCGCSSADEPVADPTSAPDTSDAAVTDTSDAAQDVVEPLDAAPDTKPEPSVTYAVLGNTMRDPAGNVLFLRGVNLSGRAKGAPGHLIDVDDALIDELIGDGVDSVRFLTFWDAVMPDGAEQVDDLYLSELRARVQRLSDAGIAVIIDVHQDLWGHPFAVHGAPLWACPAETTDGYESRSPWWANYLSDQISGCFDVFWGSPELQSAYGDMLAAVAEVTCDIPLVVGFDIMNEPWPGTYFGQPTFDNDLLMPFYVDVLHRVEEVCDDKLFFFEPSGAFTFGLSSAMELPTELRDRVVVAPHFYPPYVHEPDGGGYGGDDKAHEALIDDLTGDWEAYFDMGVALWCGEYGGMTESNAFDLYMQHLHSYFVEHFVSSAYWDHATSDGGFAFLDSAGALKASLSPVFRTPTPTLLPDLPTSFSVEWAERSFALTVPCTPERSLAVLLPGPGCACQMEPPLPLSPDKARPHHSRWICADTGPVSLSCACP